MNSTLYELVGFGGPLGVPHLIAVLVAVAGLWLGSEIVTKSARVLAHQLGVSNLIIGLTVVSIASSLPEIFVNITAVLRGADDVASGNIVGSCFVQISLVLGLCALIAGSLTIDRGELNRDGVSVMIANFAFVMVTLDGRVSIVEAAVLVALYAAYLTFVVWSVRGAGPRSLTRASPSQRGEGGRLDRRSGSARPSAIALHTVVVLAGVGLVWLMATLMVDIGRAYGEKIGISDAIIGIWAGIGTTIPEFVISVTALLPRASGISIGNLIGSNITDPLLSFGIGVLVSTGGLSMSHLLFDTALIWLVVTISVVALFYANGRLGRLSGLALIVVYVAGQVYLISA